MTAQSPSPMEDFKPSNGTVMGWGSVVGLVLVLVVALADEPNLVGARVALGVALSMAVVWAVLLRPRVRAYPDRLVLRHMLSDTWLPLAEVEEVTVRHTLNVWVGERRYTCAGIGRSTRQLLRHGRPGGAGAGLGGLSGHPPETARVPDYPTFVEMRIRELARTARREGGTPPPVRRVWAVPELAAISALAAAFLVSLFL